MRHRYFKSSLNEYAEICSQIFDIENIYFELFTIYMSQKYTDISFRLSPGNAVKRE